MLAEVVRMSGFECAVLVYRDLVNGGWFLAR